MSKKSRADAAVLFQNDGVICSSELVGNLQSGDSVAAFQLHDLFAQRLLTLVRQRMNPALVRRIDPEDVVQSAFRSFFRVVSSDDWNSQGRTERIWSLLCAITLNKLNAQARFHTAAKRSINQEVYEVDFICQDDAQEAEAIFIDELERVMQEITSDQQHILELLLNGRSEADVAKLKQCSRRTVYRVLERVVKQLQASLSG